MTIPQPLPQRLMPSLLQQPLYRRLVDGTIATELNPGGATGPGTGIEGVHGKWNPINPNR
jgi:hypothetical protein